MSESLSFDLTPTVIPVTVGGTEYELREASGDAACRWRNSMLSRTKLGPDGKPSSLGDIADTEPILVALCLYPKGSDKNVGAALVRSWPSRIQKALFAKAKEISDLEEEDGSLEGLLKERAELDKKIQKLQQESAKNDQEDTTDG